MEVSGQLHDQAALLSGKYLLVPRGQETGRAVLITAGKDFFLPLLEMES
jgi:hypothetical protein